MTTKKYTRMLNGYRVVYKPGHPKAMSGNWDGYVYEHILVAEDKLKRSIQPGEEIHHWGGNRSHNRKENILVLTKNQHMSLHGWLSRGAPGVETFGRHGMNSGKSKVTDSHYCEICGVSLQFKQKRFCSHKCCNIARRKTDRPSPVQLKSDLASLSLNKTGKKYGVTHGAVKKWAQEYGLL